MVNLPTVPGDVLVGAASVLCRGDAPTLTSRDVQVVVAAALASLFLYLFGLADNDIVGAKKDSDRPIPRGEISLTAARIARALCLFAVMIVGAVVNLQADWWIAAFLLVVLIIVYNRTKWCLAMGLCRGFNVLCGATAVGVCGVALDAIALAAPALWTLYIAFVTWYSTGEETDPEKKRRVGFLIGAIIYLQLVALLVFRVEPLLLTGAALLVVLRLMKRFLPEVSAS